MNKLILEQINFHKNLNNENKVYQLQLMLGNAPLYTDGYFTYYHTRKNKWDK
jgi:hypothetical protein